MKDQNTGILIRLAAITAFVLLLMIASIWNKLQSVDGDATTDILIELAISPAALAATVVFIVLYAVYQRYQRAALERAKLEHDIENGSD